MDGKAACNRYPRADGIVHSLLGEFRQEDVHSFGVWGSQLLLLSRLMPLLLLRLMGRCQGTVRRAVKARVRNFRMDMSRNKL